MIKIAVVSDIHANAYAIDALILDERFNACESYFCCGDIFGYYYSFSRAIEFIKKYKIKCIQGNHDQYLINNIQSGTLPNDKFEKKYGKALSYTQNIIEKNDIDFIKALPLQRDIELPFSKSGLLCHGSPFDINEYVYPDSPDKILDKIFKLNYDFVLLGHSHYPYIFQRDQKYIINPGSVGQPRDKGGHASWAELSFDNNSVTVEHVNTTYDVTSLVNQVKSSDEDTPYLHQILLR